jgi:fimbrial isopeptide formation D2 family protein/LPXTG-motif cell wall-anchored protein
MKKIVSLVLALALVLLCVGAAVAEAPTTGTITISNAAKGETYKLFKIFDATADANGNIAYTGDIPTALADYFVKDTVGNISKNTEKSDTVIAQAVADYVYTLTESDAKFIEKKTGEGTAVQFTGLAFGYYGVTSSQGAAVTVDSTTPNATIIDKNTVTTEAHKKVNGKDIDDIYVGETVTFTAKFGPLANWIGDEQVKSYTIDDTLPEYLENVSVTSVIVYDGDPDNGGTQVGSVANPAFTNKKILVPWVNDSDASLYANKSYIKVTYTAKIGENAVIDGVDGNGNINTVGITPNKDKNGDEPFEEHITDDAEVRTYGAALVKVDGKDTTKTLKGAKFTIDGFEVEAVEGEAGVYRITGAKTGASSEMEVNENGLLYILGVKDDVTATETVAPAGYNLLSGTFTINKQLLSHTIWTKSEDRYFDAKGNLVSESSSETTTVAVSKNYTDLAPNAIPVINNAGTELPSTGGIGTTIFYILGGLLVIGAAVILVARRKAND